MNLSGKSLINVDIQPEYQNTFGFDVNDWTSELNRNYFDLSNLVFLYNGYETLGMISKENYISWLYDNGVTEEVINGSTFYDKGYAFFRYCMDNQIEEDDIVNFVQFMMRNNINDSRDLNKELWKKYVSEQKHRLDRQSLIELLHVAGDCIHIPDLMNFLKEFNNIVITGGGINECLKEVEISLKSLDKSYEVYSKFTY